MSNAGRILGLKVDNCLSRRYKELFPNLDLNPALIHRKVKQVLKYCHRNITMVVNITPLANGGNIVGGIVISQDLTDLEHATKELETVNTLNAAFDTVLTIHHVGLIVVDGTGKTTFVNQALADFLSSPPDKIIGRVITNVIPLSRLHIVASTGISEPNDIVTVQGKQLILSGKTIIKDGNIVGAVGKAVFPQDDEIRKLAEKLQFMEKK